MKPYCSAAVTLTRLSAAVNGCWQALQSEGLVGAAGAAGGIGQPLSLLLKMNPRVGELSLYDVVATPGVGADLGHIDTAAKVCQFWYVGAIAGAQAQQ